jgi:hypothetical protein
VRPFANLAQAEAKPRRIEGQEGIGRFGVSVSRRLDFRGEQSSEAALRAGQATPTGRTAREQATAKAVCAPREG